MEKTLIKHLPIIEGFVRKDNPREPVEFAEIIMPRYSFSTSKGEFDVPQRNVGVFAIGRDKESRILYHSGNVDYGLLDGRGMVSCIRESFVRELCGYRIIKKIKDSTS